MKKLERLEVVIIGGTAVGKTSMLAALSNVLDEYNRSSSGSFESTTREFKVLQERWNKIIEQVKSQPLLSTLSTGIDETHTDFVEYKFDFKAGESKKWTVLFTDTRGGMTCGLDEKLVERVNNAFGVFCVVDASVLMQCPASVNERYNCPESVKSLFEQVYSNGDGKQPRFVAFVLTKCEKYKATSEYEKKLFVRFHKVYDNIVDKLKETSMPPDIYFSTIPTMPQVRFLKLDNATGLPEFWVFPVENLKTIDCAYPLEILRKEIILRTELPHEIEVIGQRNEMDAFRRKYDSLAPLCPGIADFKVGKLAKFGDVGIYDIGNAAFVLHGDGGLFEVHGGIYEAWKENGGVNGRLGLPVSDEQAYDGRDARPGDRVSFFKNGIIVWRADSYKTEVLT